MAKEMIYQANYLINHRQNMSRDENRFFLTLVSQIGKDDDSLTYRVPVSLFAETWDIDRSAMYRKVKDVLQSLCKKGVHVEEVTKSGKRRVFGFGFISEYEYIEGSAVAEVTISAKFKPYLLELKKAYTGYTLEQVVKLDAAGAGYLTIRMYEICVQWLYKGDFQYNVVELKDVLDIKDKYPRLFDLKKYVLKPAVDLINAVSDISIDYNVSGRGSAAVISFTVQRKPMIEEVPEDVPAVEPEPEDVPEDIYLLLDGGDDVADIYREGVEAVHSELRKLPAEFSYDEAELAYKYALQNGCDGFVEISDYASLNVQYCRIRWKSIKQSKNGYVLSAFCENFAKWSPNR